MNRYKRLQELRRAHGLTQDAVARRLFMKQPQYQRYESGVRDLPADVLLKLTALYNTSADYILGRTDDPRPYPAPKKRARGGSWD
jgi:transcriptional regulator with XRE-family HTH domain